MPACQKRIVTIKKGCPIFDYNSLEVRAIAGGISNRFRDRDMIMSLWGLVSCEWDVEGVDTLAAKIFQSYLI